MTIVKSSRINARLPAEVARKLAYLESRTKTSTTEVILASIERYYAAVSAEESTPARLLEEAGFIGCANGPASLSSSYKQTLARSLGSKT